MKKILDVIAFSIVFGLVGIVIDGAWPFIWRATLAVSILAIGLWAVTRTLEKI